MSVTVKVLATSPYLHYPLNETSGLVAVDATGNGRDGAYSGTKTLNQTGLCADGAAVLFGTAGVVTPPTVDLSNRSYAVGGFVRFATLVDVRYFFQARNSNAAGQNLHSYVTAGGILTHNYFFDDYNTGVQRIFAATRHYIVIRYNHVTDESTIYVDGVLRATGAGRGPLTTVPSLVRWGMDQVGTNQWGATAQHLTIWRDTIPSGAQIAAIWAERDLAGDAPDEPGAFTEPDSGVDYDASINVAWGVSPTAVTYDLDYSLNGGGYVAIATGIVGAAYVWNCSAIGEGSVVLRVRAVNTYGESSYRASDAFNIDHPPPPDPGAFTEPDLGDTVTESLTAAWGASAGADEYDLDVSFNGGADWESVATGIVGTSEVIDTSAWTITDEAKLRVRAVSDTGESDWVESDLFSVIHYDPGLNSFDTDILFEDDHTVPEVGEVVLGASGSATYVIGGAPYEWDDGPLADPAKWTPIGPGANRWREGHGFNSVVPIGTFGSGVIVDGAVGSIRQVVVAGFKTRHALAFFNGAWVTSYTANPGYRYNSLLSSDQNYENLLSDLVYADLLDPYVANEHEHLAILEATHPPAATIAGFFTVKSAPAMVFLFRDPVSGAGVVFLSDGYGSASLRFYDGESAPLGYTNNFSGTLVVDGETTLLQPMPWKHAWFDDVTVLYEIDEDFILTIFFASSGYNIDAKWSVDLSALISEMTGTFAYGVREYDWIVAEFLKVQLLHRGHVRVSGLTEGWLVKLEQRYFRTFPSDRHEVTTIEATADGDGVAKLYLSPRARSVVLDPPGGSPDDDAPDIITFDRAEVWIDDVTRAQQLDGAFRMGEHLVWGPSDLPAYAPVSIITPASREIVTGGATFEVSWAEHAPVHESEAVEYEGEYSSDGGETWAPLFAWQSAATFDWDHSAVAFAYEAMIRVRARGVVSELESGWRESDTFVVFHSGEASLEAEASDTTRASVTDHSVLLQVADFEAAGLAETRWQIWNAAQDTLLLDLYKSNEARLRDWITGLSSGTLYYARYKLVDFDAVESAEWSPWMDFTTTRMNAFQPHYAKDEKGNVEGNYRNVDAPFIDGVAAGLPEFPSIAKFLDASADRVGAKLNMTGLDLSQDPEPTHHVIRFMDTALRRLKGGGHRREWTAMLLCIPMDISAKREIMGQPSDHFVWHDEDGELFWTAVASDDAANSGNQNASMGDGAPTFLLLNEVNSIFIGAGDEWFKTILGATGVGSSESFGVEYREPLAPEEEVRLLERWVGHNGSWVMKPFPAFGATGNGLRTFDHTHPQYFDVGHGSVNAAGGLDQWANGEFGKFIAVAFAYWTRVLTVSEVAYLDEFKGNEELLDQYIAEMDNGPLIYSKINEFPVPDKPTPGFTVVESD